MEFRRRQMKIERSPEEKARLKAVRERFQKEKPALDELVASGEYTPPIKQAEYWELMKTAAALKQAREEAGISLRQMAERMAMDVGALSRLENGVNSNPTLETLFRYANSLGKKVLVQLVDLPKNAPRKKKSAL
ncbi:MAG TPA: helix-turn-helix transcriptional regulator [Pirellulales bacterium]